MFADSLIVGFNTQTPLQVYSMSGVYQQDFGPAGASAGIIEDGLLYVVQPNTSTLDSSTITAFDKNQHAVSSFTIPYLIGDGTAGPSGTLWLAGYNGTVYQVTTSGHLESSFSTGYNGATAVGIASNGTNLFTTEGDTSDGIDERNASGTIIKTFHTGYKSLYGLAFDDSSSTFFAGSFNSVYQLQLSSTPVSLVSTLNLPGDLRTPNGAIHDGLDIGDLSSLIVVPPPVTVPEPGFGLLFGIALLALLIWRARRHTHYLRAMVPVLAITGLSSATAFAAVTVHLTASRSTVPKGETVSFTATATDSTNSNAKFMYQFAFAPHGTSTFSVVKNFYWTNTLDWSPTPHEGSYDMQVIAQSSSGASGSAIETIFVTSRVSGNTPVVSPTANPLVAYYSVPPCSAPKKVRVRFKTASDTTWQVTPLRGCYGSSVNFFIAGMRANTTYILQQDLFNGPFDTPGPQLQFKTGNPSVSFPVNTTLKAAEAPTNTTYPFEVSGTGGAGLAYATDLQQRVVWYLPEDFGSGYLMRPVPGGNFLVTADDPVASAAECPSSPGVSCGDHQFFREYDTAGNLVRETNWTTLNREIDAIRAKQGKPPVHLDYISHEGYRLSNGDTLTMVTDEEIKDQGAGPVDVLGDIIVVLDSNFHAVWIWDAFDYLDVKRKSPESPVCKAGQAGCPAKFYNKDAAGHLYTVANDWTHMNSIAIDPKDGNLIASIRHQSWVVKIDYRNGAGTGKILWRLGPGGDFRLANGVPASTWFSYQHDAEFQANGALTLFDNNNLQLSSGANSRGQAWRLDETNKIATPILNVDLGVQSAAVGTAQMLSNGNYWFQAGYIFPGAISQSSEWTPAGDLVYKSEINRIVYRTFRVPSIYYE
jgi:hypothetical protein